MCSLQEWQLCLPYFCSYLPLLYLTLIMHLCPLCKSNTFWNILMILGINEEQDHTTCHIQEWQLFLLLELSPLVFEFDFLSQLCNTNTLRNILMMLGTNVEQDEMTCYVQEWQLWWDCGGRGTFFFFSKKPFLVNFTLRRKTEGCSVPRLLI